MFRHKLSTYAFVILLLAAIVPNPSPQMAVKDQVDIRVDAAKRLEPLKPIWFFCYDEPNYTYAPNGMKLLNELGALNTSRVYVRS